MYSTTVVPVVALAAPVVAPSDCSDPAFDDSTPLGGWSRTLVVRGEHAPAELDRAWCGTSGCYRGHLAAARRPGAGDSR